MVLMGQILACAWLILAAATVFWWLTRQGTEAAEVLPEADPYAAKVSQFRRLLHDWDRSGGTDAG